MSIGALDAAAAYGRSISIGGGSKAPSAPAGPDQAGMVRVGLGLYRPGPVPSVQVVRYASGHRCNM